MTDAPCHAEADPSVRQRAKALVLRGLGVKRVAGWCGIKVDTVYQLLGRGTNEHPLPLSYVAKIVAGAKADGIDFDPAVLWPGFDQLMGGDPDVLRVASAS